MGYNMEMRYWRDLEGVLTTENSEPCGCGQVVKGNGMALPFVTELKEDEEVGKRGVGGGEGRVACPITTEGPWKVKRKVDQL